MQPPANASRGRGSSLPQASRSSALWRPPICRGAGSRASVQRSAITRRSSCATARTGLIRRTEPLPCWRRSRTIGARSLAARAPISTPPPAVWPRSRTRSGSLGSFMAMPSASGLAPGALISSSAKVSRTPFRLARLCLSSTSRLVSPPPISASSSRRRGSSVSGSRGTMMKQDAMHQRDCVTNWNREELPVVISCRQWAISTTICGHLARMRCAGPF